MTEHTRRTKPFKDVRARVVETAPASRSLDRSNPWLLLAFAASLIACLALGALVYTQHHELEAAASPRPNPPILDLDPIGIGARGEPEPTKVPLSSSTVVLILNLFEPRVYPRYELEITDRQGRVLWSSTDIQRTEVGNFTLALSQGFLPPAHCFIRLFGLESRRRELLATYLLDPDSEEIP